MGGLRDLTVISILVLTPVTWWAAYFLWRLYDDERGAHDGRRVTLALALAVSVTGGSVAATLLAIPTVTYLLQLEPELQRTLGALALVAIDLLLVAMILPALYLRIRRSQKGEG